MLAGAGAYTGSITQEETPKKGNPPMITRAKFDQFFTNLTYKGNTLKAKDGASKSQMMFVLAGYIVSTSGDPSDWDAYITKEHATLKEVDKHFGRIKNLNEKIHGTRACVEKDPNFFNEYNFKDVADARKTKNEVLGDLLVGL